MTTIFLLANWLVCKKEINKAVARWRDYMARQGESDKAAAMGASHDPDR